MRWLVSIWGWLVFGTVMVVGLPWMALMAMTLPRALTWRAGQLLYRGAFWLVGVRIVLRGLEKLEQDRPYVFVGNHVSLFDPFVLCCAFPKPMTGLEKRSNFKIPIYGFMMKRWGILPITPQGDTAQSKRDMLAAREVLLRDRSWVVVFPEGRRTRDGALQPFKKGAAHLAIDAGVEMVPFVMNGSVEFHRTGAWLLAPSTIEVEVGSPIQTSQASAAQLTAQSRAVVSDLYRPPAADS